MEGERGWRGGEGWREAAGVHRGLWDGNDKTEGIACLDSLHRIASLGRRVHMNSKHEDMTGQRVSETQGCLPTTRVNRQSQTQLKSPFTTGEPPAPLHATRLRLRMKGSGFMAYWMVQNHLPEQCGNIPGAHKW